MKRKRTKILQFDWYGDDFMRIVEDHGQEALIAAAELVLADAKRRAPWVSGYLVQSAYWAVRGKTTYRKLRPGQKKPRSVPNDRTIVFGFTAPHSHLVEKRTLRHVIAPRAKSGTKALKIYSLDMIRARAKHPGTKARRYFGPAVEASRGGMVQEIAQVLRVKLAAEMPEAD